MTIETDRKRPEQVKNKERLGKEKFTLTAKELKEIIETNDAFRVCNLEGSLTGNFSPEVYKERLAEAVLVEYPDGIKVRIQDGHHRLLGAYFHFQLDQLNESQNKLDPDFEIIEVLNNTDFLIEQNSTLGKPGYAERKKYKTILPPQYYTHANDPRVIHQELDPDRRAMHFFTEWKAIVGDQQEKEVSALAVILTLGRKGLKNQYDEETLKKYFPHNDKATTEKEKKQNVLHHGYREMGRFIGQGRHDYEDFLEVVSDVIALPEKAEKYQIDADEQINGIFSLSEISEKLIRASTESGRVNETMLNRHKTKLAQIIKSSFQSLSGTERDYFYTMILDPNFTVERLITLIVSKEDSELFSSVYEQAKRDHNIEMITKRYRKGIEKKELSDVAKSTITNLCVSKELNQQDVANILRQVTDTEHVVTKARNFITEYQKLGKSDELINTLSGIIDEILSTEEMMSFSKLGMRRKRIQDFLDSYSLYVQPAPEVYEIVDLREETEEKRPPSAKPRSLQRARKPFIREQDEELQEENVMLREANERLMRENQKLQEKVILLQRKNDILSEENQSLKARQAKTEPEKGASTHETIDWTKNTIFDNEGTTEWFQNEPDLVKATLIIDQGIQSALKLTNQRIGDWAPLRSKITYKQPDGKVVKGFDAIHEAITPNLTLIAKELGLSWRMPEFLMLALSPIVRSAQAGRSAALERYTNPLNICSKKLLERMRINAEVFSYLECLLYIGNLDQPQQQTLLQEWKMGRINRDNTSFEARAARADLLRNGTVQTQFIKKFFGK